MREKCIIYFYLSHEIIPYTFCYFFARRISIASKITVERYDNVQFSLIKCENFDAWILNIFVTRRNTERHNTSRYNKRERTFTTELFTSALGTRAISDVPLCGEVVMYIAGNVN